MADQYEDEVRWLRWRLTMLENAVIDGQRRVQTAPPPCGSLRVLEWIEGNESRVRYCERTGGLCAYPGSDESRSSARRCPVENDGSAVGGA